MSNSEHLVAIVSFEGALKREIKRVRRELAKCDALPFMRLQITAEGRLHDGDMKLSYCLADQYGINSVTGDELYSVVDEFLRQHGWQARHAPTAIAYHAAPSDETEEPEPVEGPTKPDDEILF